MTLANIIRAVYNCSLSLFKMIVAWMHQQDEDHILMMDTVVCLAISDQICLPCRQIDAPECSDEDLETMASLAKEEVIRTL